MEDGSSIGFHVASVAATGNVSSVGNALVGAYLSKTLSLPLDAIVYITQAQPDATEWLCSSRPRKLASLSRDHEAGQADILLGSH